MWYDILVEKEFLDYFENNVDIDRDANDENSTFCKFSKTVEGLMLAEIVRDHPIIEVSLDTDVQAAYLFFMRSDNEGKNFAKIADSIREFGILDWYSIAPERLSPLQLAFLIIYPFASRMDGSFELDFVRSGKLKQYLKCLTKREAHCV